VFENVEKEADVAEKVEASKDRTSLQQEIECKSYWGSIFIKKFLNIVYAAQKHREIYAWLAPVTQRLITIQPSRLTQKGLVIGFSRLKFTKIGSQMITLMSGCMQNVSLFSMQIPRIRLRKLCIAGAGKTIMS
jgi:hypothetical protein